MMRRLSCMLCFVCIFAFRCNGQIGQSSDSSVMTPQFRKYLHLSPDQERCVSQILRDHSATAANVARRVHEAEAKSGVDPSVSTRTVEQSYIALQDARRNAEDRLRNVLSSDQVALLLRLRSDEAETTQEESLRAEATSLGLIPAQHSSQKQGFGGTTPIFANNTAAQPNLPPRKENSRRKPLSTRQPPPPPQ
jgi:hypothetical protein